jgi:non-homologous end joining protein Ku
MKAAPSNRAYEHAMLACGLITVPVSVYTGIVSDAGIKRNMFTPDDHPIGYSMVDKVTGEVVERAEIVKKIATEHGHVYVEDQEIEQLFDLSPKTITIKQFQPQHLFYGGSYVPKSPYNLEASKMTKGSKKIENKAAQQTLALVLEAMRAEGAIAVVEFTTRGVPKPGVLLPDGTLWVVYHDDELREKRPAPDVELAPALIAQGQMLIRSMWSTEPLDLTDHRTALIQNFADEKAAAGDFAKPVEKALAELEATAPADLMALLTASVDAAKASA